MGIKECNATEIVCPTFTSSELFTGINITDTRKLKPGEFCTYTVDASEWVGRLLFVNNADLGMMYAAYQFDTWITVPQGEIMEITIYNAKKTAVDLSYSFVFSGGQKL